MFKQRKEKKMIKFLKVKDIQNTIGCSKQTAYDLVRLKDFPKMTIGRRYYISEEDFYKWLDNNKTSHILLHKK